MMQHALKLALVDPKQLQDRREDKHIEYRELNKPIDGRNRASLSLEMKNILADPDIPDDLKLRMYSRTLDRFLNVRDKVKEAAPLPPIQVNWIAAADDEQQQLQPKPVKKVKWRKAVKKDVAEQTPSRKSNRLSRKKRKWLEF